MDLERAQAGLRAILAMHAPHDTTEGCLQLCQTTAIFAGGGRALVELRLQPYPCFTVREILKVVDH